ncbi:MAG: hypothetical protein FH749_07865 [Firmicutes bacterium]|nr:hypothetical protein [Bacillota bacterium]
MKYQHKHTGTIVNPVDPIAAETFKRSTAWEPYRKRAGKKASDEKKSEPVKEEKPNDVGAGEE